MLYVPIEQHGDCGLKMDTTKLLDSARAARSGAGSAGANSLLSQPFAMTPRLEGRLHDR